MIIDLATIWRRFRKNRLATVAFLYLLVAYLAALLTPVIAPYEPDAISLGDKLVGISSEHWLGTDHLGRDTLSRLLFGARVSLSIGLVAMGIAMLVGTSVGLVAAYLGGPVGALLMRLTDGWMSIPLFFLLLVAMTGFSRSLLTIMVVIGLTRWMIPARVVRSEVLKVKQEEFIIASESIGASKLRVLITHLLPHAIPSMLVAATLGIAQAILIESALSYIGLGIQPPQPSWGNMLLGAQSYVYTSPLLAVYPGLFIFITVMAYNSVGDGLRDALDPYSRTRSN